MYPRRNVLVIGVISMALGFSGGRIYGQDGVLATDVAPENYQELQLSGDDVKNGTFDISLEYDANGVGWMVYSVVEIPQRVSTHVAKSLDHGTTWNYVSTINEVQPAKVKVGWRKVDGLWRNETPTLAYDPGDPGKEWKLFWHKYFAKPPYRESDRVFANGWIAYRHAPSPEGPWSEEIPLFGTKEVGAKVVLKDLDPSLKKVLFLLEPGAIVVGDTIYVCADTNTTSSGLGDWGNRKIILLSSADHGQTWKYVGAITDGKDARHFGYAALTGSSLVKDQGRLFLLITPSGSSYKSNRGHDGTMVAEFADISQAKLVRDADGNIAPVKYLGPKFDMGGLADYDEQNFNGGIVMPQINLKSLPVVYRVVSTQQGLLPAKR